MTNNKTAQQKVFEALTQLRETLNVPRRISVSTVFEIHALARDYSTLICKRNIIQVAHGGKRGGRYYQWNKEVELTFELAMQLTKDYNELRKPKGISTTERRVKQDLILEALEDIKDLLLEIKHQRELVA